MIALNNMTPAHQFQASAAVSFLSAFVSDFFGTCEMIFQNARRRYQKVLAVLVAVGEASSQLVMLSILAAK